jgi:hypothetical protein
MRVHLLGAIAALLFLMTGNATAACSETKVKQLHKAGRTIAAISAQCDMSKSDVRDIVAKDEDEEPDDDKEAEKGLPNGTRLMGCGCHGPVAAWAVRPEPRCASGRARPRMCPGMCPMGGAPWSDHCAR